MVAVSQLDDIMSVVREHPTVAAGVGAATVAGVVMFAVRGGKKTQTPPASQTTAQNPVNGTVDIGGQPGVLGFVGWAPAPPNTPPTTTPPTPTQSPASSGGTVYNWRPTGIRTAHSPGGMVWYALQKGTQNDPNAYYINVYNRSGALMDTINRGCVNKDTPQGEMCVGFNTDWGPGKGGPYAASTPNYGSIQPYGGTAGFQPVGFDHQPAMHIVQPGETAAALARHYFGDAGLADHFLSQNPSWESGAALRVR